MCTLVSQKRAHEWYALLRQGVCVYSQYHRVSRLYGLDIPIMYVIHHS